MQDSPQQPPALVPDLLTESPHLCSIIGEENPHPKTVSKSALKDMSSPKLDRTPPTSSSDADKEWTMDRVLLWLASNQFSSDWQETFRYLNIYGSTFLGLGSGYGGRGTLGMLHQQVFPRLAMECSASGTGWDQVKERAEGKRIRRLITGIATGKARVVTDLPKGLPLLELTTGILRLPSSSPSLKYSLYR
jgi:mitogen-activated protein kinase kinase kinase